MKKLLPFLTLFISITSTIAQDKDLQKAEKAFEQFSYLKAQEVFEKVYESGYVTPSLLEQLGDSYYFVADYEKAFKYYKERVENFSNASEIYQWRYNLTKKSTNKLSPDITKQTIKYKVSNATFNSSKSDYAPAFFNDNIIFSSSRDRITVLKRTQEWTGDVFTDLFLSNQSELTVEPLSNKLNSKFNEGTVVFDSINQKLYFTRNNYFKSKKGISKENSTLLKIYSANLNNNEWTNIQELPINSDDFNTAHPALSADGKFLFFSSDRPGGYGNSDIYKVEILGDNLFGEPQNLGKSINTIARESFPFVSKGKLYFSSDRADSFGGLDVFNFDFNTNKIIQLSAPINSNQDDFSLIINESNSTGYFTSNRDGGKGGDDIYFFNWEKPKPISVELIVYDANTKKVIPNATVEWKSEDAPKFALNSTNTNGFLALNEIQKSTYIINASKEGYIKNGVISTFTLEENKVELFLNKEQQKLAVGDDLKLALQINKIYFDLDKFNIRQDAAADLMKLKLLLDQYPEMHIEINSHTDSRQTKQYNMLLSKRRAFSTYNWLVNKGIKKNRLKYNGYGESKLVNNCSDAVNCSEEEHQKNRRSEFIITKI